MRGLPQGPAGRTLPWIAWTLLASAPVILAAPAARAEAPAHQLTAGTVELGLGGSFTSVESTTELALELRAGRFFGFFDSSSLLGGELQLGYGRLQELDRLDLAANVSWQPVFSTSPLHPFLALSAGLRQEWIGSFSQIRHPVGLDLGLRALAGARVLVRVEYRYRRVLGDPVSDFDEHHLVFGLSLLLGSSR